MPNDAAAEPPNTVTVRPFVTTMTQFASLICSVSLLGGEPIRAIEQSFAMMKSFTGSVAMGRPPLTIDSLLVRPEAQLPRLPD
jgi:hypothetical protein